MHPISVCCAAEKPGLALGRVCAAISQPRQHLALLPAPPAESCRDPDPPGGAALLCHSLVDSAKGLERFVCGGSRSRPVFKHIHVAVRLGVFVMLSGCASFRNCYVKGWCCDEERNGRARTILDESIHCPPWPLQQFEGKAAMDSMSLVLTK